MPPKNTSTVPVRARRERSSRAQSVPLVGPWRLAEQAARGLWSDIFFVRPSDSPDDAPCDYAMKLLRDEHVADPVKVNTIQREAIVGRTLSHPHLISILSSHAQAEPYYVVMPRLKGCTLRAAIDACGRLAIPQALWIVRQVADALRVMHDSGWLHCDIKPDNIFVSPCGHVTLLDLGFAGQSEHLDHRSPLAMRGTLSYLAPEMFTSTRAWGPASDVYSLGITLFEALTGHLPFDECDPARLAEAHLRRVAPSPRTFVANLPRSVSRLVQRMVAKDPGRRPSTNDELYELLARLEIETFGLRPFVEEGEPTGAAFTPVEL